MTAYGFNEGDAKRIGRAVRAVERDPTKVRLGGPHADGAAPGVRLMIARHEGTHWPIDSTAIVTIYNGDQGAVASAATTIAYNQYIRFGSPPVCTSRWVALGHNGFNWVPVDSQDDCGDCDSEIGGIDFSVFLGFEKTNTQILGHDGSGCIRWYDIFACATAST